MKYTSTHGVKQGEGDNVSYTCMTKIGCSQFYGQRHTGKGISKICSDNGAISREMEMRRNNGKKCSRPQTVSLKAVNRAKRPGLGGSPKRCGLTQKRSSGKIGHLR